MIQEHPFIFVPSVWLGEGTITLSMVDEPLQFVTKWQIQPKDASGGIECSQEVQIKGIQDVMNNQFLFFDINSANFSVILENNTLGKVEGSGVMNPQVFGWEFKAKDIDFQGFEFYEKQDDELYLMRAEYASADDYRTIIRGKIWKKK